jgi:uncharacterized membrane protein
LPARIADRVTAVFGSWPFILVQTALIIVWIGYNGYVAIQFARTAAFDPYPFILLNLLFSTQAAYAAPLILLSQNRTAEGDGSRQSMTLTSMCWRCARWRNCWPTCAIPTPGSSCSAGSTFCYRSRPE